MGKYGPKKAFGLIKSYTADGDDLMAARIYSESLIGFQKYMDAIIQAGQQATQPPQQQELEGEQA